MSKISTSDVQKLTALSALTLSDDEMTAMQADLTEILGYVEQLGEVDTTGVTPTYQPHDLETVVREDIVIDYGVTQDDLLKNAPKKADSSVVVPRVLE